MINPNYIPYPYGILICGKNASIKNTKNLVTTYQSYPTSRTDGGKNDYNIIAIEPTGRDANMTYCVDGYERNISARPQVHIGFEGKTLFNMPADDKFNYFTEIPSIFIDLEEGTPAKGLELRVGNKKVPLDELFMGGHASFGLKSKIRGTFTQYGTYSIRLYQADNFIKQIEFNYVPNIKTDYDPQLDWPDSKTGNTKIIHKFERITDWSLEFPNCVVKNDEKNYIVECPSNAGTIQIILKSDDEDVYFSHQLEIPIRPFEISVLDASGEKIEHSGKLIKLELNEFQEQYWISLECYGDYKEYHYRLRLKTANGIEQIERLALSYAGCGNLNLSCFSDTLKNCPLPAQIELCCDEHEEKTISIMVISDIVHLHKRPGYASQGFILIDPDDSDKDLTVKKFGDKSFEMKLLREGIIEIPTKAGGVICGFKCEKALFPGIYIFQKTDSEILFDFEDEGEAIPTDGRETMYISGRKKDDPIFSFSDWLDQLIKDILATGSKKALKDSVSYRMLDKLKEFSDKTVLQSDLIKLVSLAYFHDAIRINDKKDCIEKCMHSISEMILNGGSRYEMIRVLADLESEPEIFEKCMRNYNLLLFEVGRKDSKRLAEIIENKSAELSLLLRMGVDDSVRNTIWREKYRELIGRETIRTLLSVPDEEEPSAIAEEQKKFLREQSPCKVHINLTREISGDMKPIQEMITFYKNDVYLDLRKKPDYGIYMDYIRYVDQYVNWYKASHDKKGDMYKWKKDRMIGLVETDCRKLMKGLKDIKTVPELRKMVNRYEQALSYRFDGDPEDNLRWNKHDRFFYLQGIAAFLSKLPAEYRKRFAHAIRPAEHFMTVAMTIAPRIAQRDLIMASTFIYLVRKEDKLCQ